ncbi:uncharacterized protein LOC124936222 [Impatiens glandulifera]|uniref:uncharacterized protein LOC124936222 n=1 Tax=Impatiens glandulifera TaxID=253017 RepID=UPI001FB11029|nr:uncharacterized protein LOC124936222 [Impatiens glandulifera]
MNKARNLLSVDDRDSELVSRLTIPTHRIHIDRSFYEDMTLRGIRVDRVQPGFVSCSFKVPSYLSDSNGKLAAGAIANLVDELGGAVIMSEWENEMNNVSVDMSISYVSAADVDEELEITARLLGKKGGFFGTNVVLKNKITGDIIAEGRHSLFNKHASKM